MSSPFFPLRPSTITRTLIWILAPLLWCGYVHAILNPMLAAGGLAAWAHWGRLLDRLDVGPLNAPPLVVVSPESLVLRTQTRRDTLRQVFEVVGIDAAGCIRHAGATEVLRTQTAPVYVFLRPLSVPLCSPELSP